MLWVCHFQDNNLQEFTRTLEDPNWDNLRRSFELQFLFADPLPVAHLREQARDIRRSCDNCWARGGLPMRTIQRTVCPTCNIGRAAGRLEDQAQDLLEDIAERLS